LNNFTDATFEKIKKKKYDKVIYEAIIYNILLFVLLFLCIFFPTYYWSVTDSAAGYVFFILFWLVPIIITGMIFNFNTGRAAAKLKSYQDEIYAEYFNRYSAWRAKRNKDKDNKD